MTPLLDDIAMVAFDLDGTLVDSAPDLALAVSAMLDDIGAHPLPQHEIIAMIGDGIDALVARALRAALGRSASEDEQMYCLPRVIARYGECVVQHSRLYPGVEHTLAALRERGKQLCCITNKYSQLTLPLIEAMRIGDHFDHILCAESAAERKPAPLLLERAFALCAVAPRTVLMVGDSCDDVAAARAAGCQVAAVRYGYSAPQRLLDAGADWLLDSLQELPRLQRLSSGRPIVRAAEAEGAPCLGLLA